MKQIIPFNKELLFKTKLSEITSISLEHTLTLKNDDLISGEFYISGDYKMTEGSINREKFQFKLPFDIALDSRYDMSSIIIDIDNFYYEIINNEALQVNIDVYVEGEKIEEPPVVEELQLEELQKEEPKPNGEKNIEESTLKEEKKEEVLSSPKLETTSEDRGKLEIETSKKEIKEEKTNSIEEVDAPQILRKEEFEQAVQAIHLPKTSLEETVQPFSGEFNPFDNLDNVDTYVTYYVYITKEEDTLEKILTKYNVTKEDVALYNNIEEIKPGTKLIIPSINHE